MPSGSLNFLTKILKIANVSHGECGSTKILSKQTIRQIMKCIPFIAAVLLTAACSPQIQGVCSAN